MRFLVDQAVSWQVASDLATSGHDAVHVGDLGLSDAGDRTILERAASEERIIITQDTDFGALLARTKEIVPSVILFRGHDGRPSAQYRTLIEHLSILESDLTSGAIVVITDRAIRVRRLPITE